MTAAITLHVDHADGVREQVEWPLDKTVIKIGRAPSCQVLLHDERASRMHAVIERTGDELVVIDLGTEEGTKVNGAPYSKSRLAIGDVITIGGTTVTIALAGQPSEALASFDEPPRVGSCPRCEQPMSLGQAEPIGYRDTPMRFLRCDACAICAIESAALEARWRDARLPELSVRAREPAGERCPACLDELSRVTLEWDSRWVALESCDGCGAIVLDDGEGFTLDALIQALSRS